MTQALHSLCRPSAKCAFTHHRHRPVVVWACGYRAPSGGGSAGRAPSPAQHGQASRRHRGLCIGALLASTISTVKLQLTAICARGILWP